MSNRVSLFCLVHGHPFSRAFPVKIDKEETIGVLKKVIKEENKPEFDSFAANHLQLWKVEIRYGANDELKEFKPKDDEVLSPMEEIGEVFQGDPIRRHVHIIVEVPGKLDFVF
jgi:hypothetical protein